MKNLLQTIEAQDIVEKESEKKRKIKLIEKAILEGDTKLIQTFKKMIR
ncbi:MAG: hypothetical protein KIT33_01240 [Candidatus Kapabacteria bacterium]|nr:hypothetical protein [Ignavibacteriota bacterium]MCW5883573.1 hypothetical protein [Candidatus Kapabacteria bacterium]